MSLYNQHKIECKRKFLTKVLHTYSRKGHYWGHSLDRRTNRNQFDNTSTGCWWTLATKTLSGTSQSCHHNPVPRPLQAPSSLLEPYAQISTEAEYRVCHLYHWGGAEQAVQSSNVDEYWIASGVERCQLGLFCIPWCWLGARRWQKLLLLSHVATAYVSCREYTTV